MENLATRLRELRTRAKRSASELSIAAGLSKNTVAEIENNPTRSPRLEAVQSLARELGVSLSYLAEGKIENARSDGFEESDAQQWDLPPPAGQRPDLIDTTNRLLRTLAPEARNPTSYRLVKGAAGFGLLSGDVLVVDLKARPENGDLVLATVADLSTGHATTVLRRLMAPYLISSEYHEGEPPLVADGARTAVVGKVVASFRAPQIA